MARYSDRIALVYGVDMIGAGTGAIAIIVLLQFYPPDAVLRIIGVLGTLIGTAGGVLLALNVETIVPAIEQLFNVQFLAADVYYISDVPSELHWNDVWVMAAVALVLSLLATLYPAWRAARTLPAEALRYE